MADDEETIWVDVVQKHETEKAYLFEIEGEEIWVPKSCTHGRRKENEKIVRCEISAWFCKKEGIE